MNNAWWRPESLNDVEQRLLAVLFQAHHLSCFRPNVSSITVANAAAGSNDVGKAIAAAILTLGGKHAPLEQTYLFLSRSEPDKSVSAIVKENGKVPGWGGTFQKDDPDPIWQDMDAVLRESYPSITEKIDKVTGELSRLGKKVGPNPSAYTAAAAIVLGLPAKLAVYLFLAARLEPWASIAFQNVEREAEAKRHNTE